MSKVLYKAKPRVGVFLYLYIFIYLWCVYFIFTSLMYMYHIHNDPISIYGLIIHIIILVGINFLIPTNYTIYSNYIQITTILKKWKFFFSNIEEIIPVKVSDYIFIPSNKLFFSFKNNIAIKYNKRRRKNLLVIIAPRDKDYKKFLEIAQKQLEKVKCGEVQDE